MSNDVTEGAKAVQETAKVFRAIAENPAANKLAMCLVEPIEQAAGMLTDKLVYMRLENLHRLHHRFESKRKEIDDYVFRGMSWKIGLPLIAAATLEDDEHLQELWENLLVNATNANSQVEVKRSFASILEDLSPLDATLLEKIYAFPYDDAEGDGDSQRDVCDGL